jgi:hypothetical protein
VFTGGIQPNTCKTKRSIVRFESVQGAGGLAPMHAACHSGCTLSRNYKHVQSQYSNWWSQFETGGPRWHHTCCWTSTSVRAASTAAGLSILARSNGFTKFTRCLQTGCQPACQPVSHSSTPFRIFSPFPTASFVHHALGIMLRASCPKLACSSASGSPDRARITSGYRSRSKPPSSSKVLLLVQLQISFTSFTFSLLELPYYGVLRCSKFSTKFSSRTAREHAPKISGKITSMITTSRP